MACGSLRANAARVDLASFPDVEQDPAVGAVPLGRAGRDILETHALQMKPFMLAVLHRGMVSIRLLGGPRLGRNE